MDLMSVTNAGVLMTLRSKPSMQKIVISRLSYKNKKEQNMNSIVRTFSRPVERTIMGTENKSGLAYVTSFLLKI